MSGLFGAITKAFTPIVEGIGHLGSAVTGVGATAFTGAAASGSTINALGTAFAKGAGAGMAGATTTGAMSGALGNILKGVGAVMTPALVGGSGGTTGAVATGGAGDVARTGIGADTGIGTTLGKTAVSGMTGGTTPTGMAPTGRTGFFSGLAEKLGVSEEMLGNAVAGLGKGIGDYSTQQAAKERDDAYYAFKDKERAQQVASYKVDPGALAGGTAYTPDGTLRQTPAKAFARDRAPFRWDVGKDESGKPKLVKVYV